MPALPNVPNVVKIVIEGTTPLFPWANVLHWQYSGAAPSSADCLAFATLAHDTWVTEFAPLMSSTGPSTIESATVTDLSSATGGEAFFQATEPGSRAGAILPASVSTLLSKSIARRYRGGHPRSYIFGGVQDDLANTAHWGAGWVTAVNAAYAAFTAALNGHTAGGTTLTNEVTVSYIDKAVNPVAPYRRPVPAVFVVGAFTTEAETANQRRRVGR